MAGLPGSGRAALRAAESLAVSVLFDGINEARREAARAKRRGDSQLQLAAINVAGQHLLQALKLSMGTKTTVAHTAGNQDALPVWSELDPSRRAKVEQLLDELGAAGIDVAALMGAKPVAALPEAL